MVTVATRIDNPMKFIMPDNNKYSILGYGDIFIPALLLSIALRIDFIEAF